MNKDEILNMPADRKLDMLVGEFVFGWESTSPDGPKFSTDISAAWEVVEKICDKNGCDVMKVCKRDPELLRGEWSCNFGLGLEAFGETASLAICRAALLASVLANSGGV